MGKNSVEHIKEMAPEDPVIFLKPNTRIIGPNVPIQLPAKRLPWYNEGELAAVIDAPQGRAAARAADVILIPIANDVSAWDQQRADGQWTRCQGGTIRSAGRAVDRHRPRPIDLEIRTEVNGQARQRSRTSLMIHTTSGPSSSG